MARADTLTMIPLDRAAYHMQLDLYHFNGITSTARRNAIACSDTWYQHDWQASGKLSRESLSTALRQAEDIVVSYLHWFPIPQWVEEEKQLQQYYKTEFSNFRNSRGAAKSVESSYGFIKETGRKTSLFISTPATVFSDEDGDGFFETVTVTFATTVTTEEELHIYYPSQDGRDEWEIKPIEDIDITAGTATIVFSKSLIPLWDLVEQIPEDGDAHININGDNNANFLQTVDVYRVYADTSQQITFSDDPSLAFCSTVPCDVTTSTGCLSVRDSRRGILAYQRADWNEDTEAFTRAYFTSIPVKGTIYYRAGKQDLRVKYPTRQVDQSLERLMVFYALSLLDTELCGCCNTRNIWQHLTKDLSEVTSQGSNSLAWDVYNNPLGRSPVALQLWKYIQNVRIAKSQAVV